MQIKYYSAALFSFIVWGLFSLVLKPLAGFPALDILLHRVAFAAIIIVLFSLLFRRKITLQNIKILSALPLREVGGIAIHTVCSALTLALNWYLYIYVMNNVTVKATSLAYLICPILTTVLAYLILKEKLNRGQWLAVGISVLSCILLAYGHFVDMIYSVIIAFTYALYLILQKKNNKLDKFFTLNLHIVIAAFLLLPLSFTMPSNIVHTTEFYSLVFIIAVLFTIIPLFLNMYALKGLDSSVVGVLLYINPIIAFMLALFYFGEEVNTLQAIAYGLIVLAVIIFNISYLRKIN